MQEILGSVLHWAYCLDLSDAVLITVYVSVAFISIKAQYGKDCWWRPALGVLLAAAMVVIVYVTVGNREYGNMAASSLVPFHSYREAAATGNVEIYRSNFMNALLFYPAGLLAVSLLPGRWHSVWRVVLVTVLFAALSAGIEYVQYIYSLGRVEMDDVIHNVLGALLGALCGTANFQFLFDSQNSAT